MSYEINKSFEMSCKSKISFHLHLVDREEGMGVKDDFPDGQLFRVETVLV